MRQASARISLRQRPDINAEATLRNRLWMICAVALLQLSAANARDMWLVGDAPNAVSFIDADSVRPTTKGRREAWIDNYEGTERPIVYMRNKALMEYDCAGERSRWLAAIWYLPNGTIQQTDREVTDWRRVAPGTMSSGWMRFICGQETSWPEVAIRVKESDLSAWAAAIIYPSDR